MNRPDKHSVRCFCTAILTLSVCMSAWAAEDLDDMDNFVATGMELWHVPGMAVTVVSGNEVLYQKGFGKTAVTDGKEIDQHTLFANASTTKAMVAAGILILTDEGKLALDDPIIKHIPELHFKDPMMTSQLTIRDLLVHRTGFPRTDAWTFFQDMPLEEQIKRLSAVSAAAPIRTKHIYQNTMYELAGLVIERVTGQRWDHFLTDRLWRPIGMMETYGTRDGISPEQSHVLPYFYNDEELKQAEWDFSGDLADAAGSAWTSIHDMGLWAQFLLRDAVTADGDRLISEESIEEMFKPQTLISAGDFYPTTKLTHPNWTSYGLGWFQQDFQGRKVDFHTGSLSGLIAIIGLDRQGDRAVVVLANRDHAELRHAVLWQVMDQSPAGELRDWNRDTYELYEDLSAQNDDNWAEARKKRLKKTRPSLPRDDYLGTYESPVMGEISIEEKDRKLIFRTKKVDMPMNHWHLDTFVVRHQPWGLREFAEFRISPDGSVRDFVLFGETFEPIQEENEQPE